MYQIELTHPGLNKYRLIKGQDPEVVQQKAAAQQAAWAEMWARKCAVEDRRANQEHNAGQAEERTTEALADLESIRNTLKKTLSVNGTRPANPIFNPAPNLVMMPPC